MKRTLLILVCFVVFVGFLYADTSVTITAQVYDNFDKILTIKAKYTIETKQIRNGKSEKDVIKNFEVVDSSLSTPNSQMKVGLYPDCLFRIKSFFSNYDMNIKQKDERIKVGAEEVIAIQKGQQKQYPQIRLFISGTKVREIKFYGPTGKKYYTAKAKKYEQKNGADFPTEIIEKFISKKTTIENTVLYSNIK